VLPPHSHRSRTCVDPAHSRRSRALASIPRARADPARSRRSRALASIPRARADPARSRRSRALAPIPRTCVDPAPSRRSRSLASIPPPRIDVVPSHDPANANCEADLKRFVGQLGKLNLPTPESIEGFDDSKCAATISKLQDVVQNADLRQALSNIAASDKKAANTAKEALAATQAAVDEVSAAMDTIQEQKVALSASLRGWNSYCLKVEEAHNAAVGNLAIIVQAQEAASLIRQKLQKGSRMRAPPSMASTATTAAPGGVHARTDPAHLRRSRARIDPAYSHRSRARTSIPRACVDPAHSHRSRAHASIPPTRIDPAHTRRSRALASIPCACTDPAHSHRSRTLTSIPCALPLSIKPIPQVRITQVPP